MLTLIRGFFHTLEAALRDSVNLNIFQTKSFTYITNCMYNTQRIDILAVAYNIIVFRKCRILLVFYRNVYHVTNAVYFAISIMIG